MTDEVDHLVAAWRRERPDLDVTPLEVLSRVSRLARHLDLARREAFTAHDIESWEFDVLAALRRAGDPYELSPGRLLRETLVTSGTMTNRVDRLVARGYVERNPDPDDPTVAGLDRKIGAQRFSKCFAPRGHFGEPRRLCGGVTENGISRTRRWTYECVRGGLSDECYRRTDFLVDRDCQIPP